LISLSFGGVSILFQSFLEFPFSFNQSFLLNEVSLLFDLTSGESLFQDADSLNKISILVELLILSVFIVFKHLFDVNSDDLLFLSSLFPFCPQ
jgi:hypothetical protein